MPTRFRLLRCLAFVAAIALATSTLRATSARAADSDADDQPMGGHMTMTTLRPLQPGDQTRANAIVVAARAFADQYKDYRKALADGYTIFHPEIKQDVYHFTNETFARQTTISFDPAHDTPKVLRAYGFSCANSKDPAVFSRWEFAAIPQAELPEFANYFALTYQEEGGLITHSLSTAVISPDGKIYKWYHGADWQASDLLQDIAAAHR